MIPPAPVKLSNTVAAVDAAISAYLCAPLSTKEVAAFAASDALPHLDDIRSRCIGHNADEVATFIAVRFLAIGLAAGLAVRESAQLEVL